MSYDGLRRLVPAWLRRQIFHFEVSIEEALTAYSASLPPVQRVLDAGAGEGRYRDYFKRQLYTGIDLGVGDKGWDYSGLDCVANLLELPFRTASFDAFVSVVTLEHVTDPSAAIAEMARVARPSATLFLVVPHEWEVHQHPHDYFRFTRYGITMLLEKHGWQIERLSPGGGYFRLLSRRLMNGLQFLPAWLMPFAAILVVPAALVVGLLDPLDTKKDYTLGYICWAKRKSI